MASVMVEGLLGAGVWAITSAFADGPTVLCGWAMGVGLLLHAIRRSERMRESAGRRDGGEGSAGAGEQWCGTWTRLGMSGVSLTRVRWDPAIRHYLLDGEVWTDEVHLAEVLEAMERTGTAPWVPSEDVHTLTVRRALGLPELSGSEAPQ